MYDRSEGWNQKQKEAYRILNAGYHNLSILTYDHILEKARCIAGVDAEPIAQAERQRKAASVLPAALGAEQRSEGFQHQAEGEG
jgi:hypothetical protein